jgi:tetrapyrrole methylase family protein/MazG family protein
MIKENYTFEDLVEIIRILRSESGCPWDREQTHDSLRSTVLEESYEVIEAINNKDWENLNEELGDLLLQILLHGQIGSENHRFSIDRIMTDLAKKLIRRHPHVFDDKVLKNEEEVLLNWDAVKKEEKNYKSLTDEMRLIPKALPALVRASKVQKKAAKVGFDFPVVQDALNKVYEEINELIEADNSQNNENIDEEFGDLLFSIVNLSRFFGLNAEFSLTNAIEKFINRFEGIEKLAKTEGRELESMSLDEMDELWNRIK